MEIGEMIRTELRRHSIMINGVKRLVYSNPIHLKGIMSYRDKKRLYELEQKVMEDNTTLSFKDFQFLESIVLKYA